jgi:hypothetical protein
MQPSSLPCYGEEGSANHTYNSKYCLLLAGEAGQEFLVGSATSSSALNATILFDLKCNATYYYII